MSSSYIILRAMSRIPVYNFDSIELFKHVGNPYRDAVISLCLEACSLAERTSVFFPEYTLHNFVHLQRVAVLEGAIIGSRINVLKQDEIALLVLAAFYHDIGMACNENEITSLKESDDYRAFREEWRFEHPNMAELERMHKQEYLSEKEKISIGGKLAEMEKALFTDYLREQHPENSKKYVLQNITGHPLLGDLAEDLGEICLSHGMSVEWIRKHPTMTPSRKFICYVLRLADIFDFDGDRTPDVLFRAISFSSPVSLQEWEKHKGVKDWSIGEDEIVFTMEYRHPAYEKAARDFIGWIDRELEQVHLAIRDLDTELPGYGIIAPTKITTHITSIGYEYHDLSFSLSRDEVVKLFLTDKLYGEKSLFVRELLQNSLDALRLRKAFKALQKEEWDKGEVRFYHYLDDKRRSVIKCVDNGCGMDLRVIEQYFGKVGRSYYRSNEFERLRADFKRAGVDFDPCSRFGIGFMSVFMVADLVYVKTRTESGDPYVVEINGLSNLFVIKKGDNNQPVGTTVKVIERNAPPAFDGLSDNIRLVDTVDSYAVACEFPVYADCTVPGIEDSIIVEAGCLLHSTFLEGLKLNGIKTYEVDFSQIDNRLAGKMRQSFLINKRGRITLKNDEAHWQRLWEDNYGVKRKQTSLAKGVEAYDYNGVFFIDSPYTISCDGVSVTGVLGRRSLHGGQRKSERSELIRFQKGCVFTQDIRGAIKPELTPARTPVEHGFEDSPGWAGVLRIVNYASCLLWEKVLNDCLPSDMPAFWSYLLIYRASIGDRLTSKMISKRALLDKVSLPVNGSGWLGLADVDSFEIREDNIFVVDKNDKVHSIQLCKSVGKWADEHDYHSVEDLASTILYRVAKLRVSEKGKAKLVIDHTPSSENGLLYYVKSEVVPFSGLDKKWIMSLVPHTLFNEDSPLVRLAASVWNVKGKNRVEEYADSLCELLYDYFNYELEDYKNVFRDAGKTMHYTGALYKELDKSAIVQDYLPPYFILGRKGEKLVITEELLLEWAEWK